MPPTTSYLQADSLVPGSKVSTISFELLWNFRAQFCLLNGAYHFDWPRFDTDFDKKMMRAVVPVDSDQVPRVQMALFPALIHTEIQDGRDGE